MQLSNKTLIGLLFIAAIILFVPFLGNVHLFDWDEINFAESSREMIATGDYTRVYIDFQPFWEKPPLFFWLQSLSMKIFGVNEFAARFPNAICGIATLIVLFLCGKKLFGKKFGLLWALAYAGSLFPNMYFKSGIIDPWFNLFIFLSLYFFILYHWKRNGFDQVNLNRSLTAYALLSGLFMGLAILTKGQVALMIFFLVMGVYLVMNRFRFYFGGKHVLLFLLAMVLVTFIWYGYETIKNGPWFINEFLKYQYRLFTTHDAGQKGFFGYHFVVILIGCFPASVFAIRSFFKTKTSTLFEQDFKKWMLILFWVVLILFSIVQSRIIHYSSLAWFPITFLAAYTFYKWERNETAYKKWLLPLTAIIGGIIALLLIAAPIIGMNLDKIEPYVKDKFARANMEASVNWTFLDGLPGVFFILMLILGLIWLKKKEYAKTRIALFGGTAIAVFFAMALIVPKVERYSQGAAVDFFEERIGEDCYVHVLGYKSYAQLFYTRTTKHENNNAYDQEWLLHGPIDKPVYFVTKINKIQNYKDIAGLQELYRKNGFVFLKREIP
ncbi:MAG TPA: glycosyltransferase family 39 protein [Chitinophagaceae bacterium]|nr:glycosyltransferase family 39 protein [Chitinophagaceae bacterium]HRX93509.1 glycosyltransferase family 39 protein [Chitinophagaceae bacterium]